MVVRISIQIPKEIRGIYSLIITPVLRSEKILNEKFYSDLNTN